MEPGSIHRAGLNAERINTKTFKMTSQLLVSFNDTQILQDNPISAAQAPGKYITEMVLKSQRPEFNGQSFKLSTSRNLNPINSFDICRHLSSTLSS